MIAKLRGIVDHVGLDHVIIDISGVGYLVYCPIKVIENLSPLGDLDELLIETIVREDQITLYGFKSEKEKYWFNSLIKVQSVGAKTAINGLSVLSIEEIIQEAYERCGLTTTSGHSLKSARISFFLKRLNM